jgi:hypothetical protein
MPVMVAQLTMPESEIATLIAYQAFKNGHAGPSQFDVMLDTRDLLLLAANAKKDEGVMAVCRAAGIALCNIRDTFKNEKFIVGEEELNALLMLVDVSKEFWAIQSGNLYNAAYISLREWRQKQERENNEDQRNKRGTH